MTALPDLCKGSLRNFVMEVETILQLDEIFSRFRKRQNYSHAFLVGATNHWSAMVGNKVNDHHELVYLDSRYCFSSKIQN
jgi:hypothetical protein